MKKLVIALVVFIAGSLVVAPAPASALFEESKQQACKGLSFDDAGACADPATTTNNANKVIRTAINIFSAIIGIIAVVMMMIGGLKYMTSQGDSSQVNSAKNTILYAAIGIVVAALAQVIARFVVARFTQ